MVIRPALAAEDEDLLQAGAGLGEKDLDLPDPRRILREVDAEEVDRLEHVQEVREVLDRLLDEGFWPVIYWHSISRSVLKSTVCVYAMNCLPPGSVARALNLTRGLLYKC